MKTFHKQAFFSIALAAAVSGGYLLHDRIGIGNAVAAVPSTVTTEPRAAVSLPDFSTIAASLGPAVVNISVSGTTRVAAGFPGMDDDSPFFEFFRRFGPPGSFGMVPRDGNGRVPTHGLGSGFIVTPDGTILTNAHVVADADEVMVKLTDKREFKAKVVGIDKQSDVAVLRIDAKDLPTVRIGDPGKVRVGEWVLAIGSPYGFDNSVTAGIISAKSRTLPDEGFVPFMQTDVAINPGNSGGPLINANGEVIGINSQIYSRSGGYQGLSFAIPIDVAMNVEQQLVTKGKVSRGRLGVMIQDVNQALADSFGLDRPRGALVSSVDPGGPAARAGLRAGDVILKFNDHEISRSSDLPILVANTKPGSDAKVELWRQGGNKSLAIALGEMSPDLAKAKSDRGSSDPDEKLGLALRPLTPEERAEVSGGKGLVVEDVGNGPAARAGIQPGDVVLAANGEPVASVEQLRGKIAHAGKRIALLIQRGEQRMFVPITVG